MGTLPLHFTCAHCAALGSTAVLAVKGSTAVLALWGLPAAFAVWGSNAVLIIRGSPAVCCTGGVSPRRSCLSTCLPPSLPLRCTAVLCAMHDVRVCVRLLRPAQEELVRADTRARELSGDLLRLQRAYDRVSQELSTHRWVVGGQGAV